MDTSYSKKEKLKSKKLIEKMFVEGRSISAFPLRLVYLETPFNDGVTIKTGVSVSKRHFKRAVDRNRIKRLTNVLLCSLYRSSSLLSFSCGCC